MEEALQSIHRSGGDPRMLYVNAWNEWPEGNYLLPDQRHGTGYLQALRDTLRTGAR